MKQVVIKPRGLLNLMRAIINEVGWSNLGDIGGTALLEAAFAEEEEPKWKPYDGDEVFALWFDGAITKDTYLESNPVFSHKLKTGAIFPTREAAEKARDSFIAWSESNK